VDEVWCITTQGEGTDAALARIAAWRDALIDRRGLPRLKIWQAAGIGDLSSVVDCERMAECIYRLVLHASERAGDGQLIISLTGGRKTMSSDIQSAAVAFGCHALVHVIQNEKCAEHLKTYGPDDFTGPLPTELKDAITPIVTGRYERSPVVDEGADGIIQGVDYPVAVPEGYGPVALHMDKPDLVQEVRARLETAGALYANNTHRLMCEESSTNFLALYNLCRPS
jgi:adenosine deaminase